MLFPRKTRKILFICKTGGAYGDAIYQRRSSGLWNSTQFVVEALAGEGIECRLAEAVDANCIDRLVSEFNPDTVVVEALWVVPEKFLELRALHHHQGREWFVHLHSNIPFLAQEGIATDWLFRYREAGVGIIVNCGRARAAVDAMLGDGSALLLPNIYPSGYRAWHENWRDTLLNVGCFGAIRPMKNQLTQAIAALEYARETGRFLRFHMNGTRSETGGGAVLKSLRNLFATAENAALVEHPWLSHHEFRGVMCGMDISLQASLSETFNIVTADAVAMGVPVVVSPEIGWVSRWCHADPASSASIRAAMGRVEGGWMLTKLNQFYLTRYSRRALRRWYRFALGAE